MSTISSAKPELQKFSFNRFPNELKFWIFALLPSNDMINCMLLNREHYNLISANLHLMRKVPRDCLFLHADEGPQLQCSIPLNSSTNLLNVIYLRQDRAYAIEPCQNILAFQERQKLRASPNTSLNGIEISHNDEVSSLLQHNFEIKSIEEGARLHLDFILSLTTPQCVKLEQDKKARFQLTDLLPVLRDSFQKNGTRSTQISLINMQITSDMVEIINILGASDLFFNECNFVDDLLLSKISIARSIEIQTDILQDPKMYQLFLEKWMSGVYRKLTTFRLTIPQEEDRTRLFEDVIKNKFKTIYEVQGMYAKMEYKRSDGWTITLMHTYNILLFNSVPNDN